MKRQKNSILSFFHKKKSTATVEHQNEPIPGTSSEYVQPQSIPISSPSSIEEVNVQKNYSSESESSNQYPYDTVDISEFLKIIPPGDDLLKIYDQVWKPSENFSFPTSQNRNLRFQSRWLKEFPWLAYSKTLDGAFCKACVLFGGTKIIQTGSQQLRSLVTEPYKKWKNALEYFRAHRLKEYHMTCVVKYESLKKVKSGAIVPINLQVDQQNKLLIEENKKRVRPIIESIIFLGRQGLALRGTHDYGEIGTEEPITNDGNFRAILRFRARTDPELREHLKTAQKNAIYISNTIQNEIIECCHSVITNNIAKKVNEARAFSILADETTDIAGIEQVSIAFRYFDESLNAIREDFFEFVPVTSTTGANLAETILGCLARHKINTEFMVGQRYDGARAMSGEFHGVQSVIRSSCPKAIYVHCAAHCFNLAVTAACEVSLIRNCLGTIEKVYDFFNTPKRLNVLKNNIPPKETRHKKLMKLCETRWVERHETVATYVELQPYVIASLEEIQSWTDGQTSSQAFQLSTAIHTAGFQVACTVLESVHSIVLPLSRMLQSADMDLVEALNLATLALAEFTRRRNVASDYFAILFKEVQQFCSTHDIEIKIPRIVRNQVHRSNVNATTAEEYFRVTVFIPFLDTYITHLHDRFTKHSDILRSFSILMRVDKVEKETDETVVNENIQNLFNVYGDLLNCTLNTWKGEVTLWRRFLIENNIKITNAVDGVQKATKSSFYNINYIFKILATIPVTTATNERSFSTLKRLKTYLRNSMGEDRLNGLASLNIHREIKLTTDEVLHKFVEKPRRLILK